MKLLQKKKNYISKGLFIKNVNYEATIEDIDIFLSNYIKNYDNLIMLKDRSNNFIGRIVIIFDNENIAINAKKNLNNLYFLNRKLKVKFAYSKYIQKKIDNEINIINLFNNNLKI
jgi:hypothetical protein